MFAKKAEERGHQRDTPALKKIVSWAGKAVMFVLIAIGVVFLLAERFQETSFVNFVRSLM